MWISRCWPPARMRTEAADREPQSLLRWYWHDARIIDRLALPVGAVVSGPAVLEQPDTTIWLSRT